MNFFGKSIKEFGVIVGIFALFVYAGCQNDISSSQNAEFGQVVVSSENRALYTSEIKSAKVSVRGYDSSGSTFVKTSGIVSVSGGKADNIAVSEIPLLYVKKDIAKIRCPPKKESLPAYPDPSYPEPGTISMRSQCQSFPLWFG